jgi:signal transduction histidine kinase
MDTFVDEGQEQAQYLRWAQLTCAGEVAAMIAHDINNAITGVISYTELAGMDLPEWSEASTFLEKTLEQAHRVSTLANQLLDLSHEAEPYPLPQDVAKSLKAACFLFARRLEKDHIAFESAPDIDGVEIVADARRLLSIWLNLLLIARSLLVGAGSESPRRLSLVARKADGSVSPTLEVRLTAACEGMPRFSPEQTASTPMDTLFTQREDLLYAATEAHVRELAGILQMEMNEGSLTFTVALPANT